MGYSPWCCKESNTTEVIGYIYIYIYIDLYLYPYLYRLLWVLVATLGVLAEAWELFTMVCGIYFPDQRLNSGPLHWEHGVLAPGPPGKPPNTLILDQHYYPGP